MELGGIHVVLGAWLMSWHALHGRLGSRLHSSVYWAAPAKKLACLGRTHEMISFDLFLTLCGWVP